MQPFLAEQDTFNRHIDVSTTINSVGARKWPVTIIIMNLYSLNMDGRTAVTHFRCMDKLPVRLVVFPQRDVTQSAGPVWAARHGPCSAVDTTPSHPPEHTHDDTDSDRLAGGGLSASHCPLARRKQLGPHHLHPRSQRSPHLSVYITNNICIIHSAIQTHRHSAQASAPIPLYHKQHRRQTALCLVPIKHIHRQRGQLYGL